MEACCWLFFIAGSVQILISMGMGLTLNRQGPELYAVEIKFCNRAKTLPIELGQDFLCSPNCYWHCQILGYSISMHAAAQCVTFTQTQPHPHPHRRFLLLNHGSVPEEDSTFPGTRMCNIDSKFRFSSFPIVNGAAHIHGAK